MNGLSTCQTRTQVWLKHLASRISHCGHRRFRTITIGKRSPTREEGSSSKWSTTSTRGSSKRGQSVPVDPSKRTNPEEQGLPWQDLGEIDVDQDYLYPVDAVIPCPVEKVEQLSPEQQPVYVQWILHVLKLDHKVDKDPRVYCSYCDVNNHPRFSCKHARKQP